MTGRERRRQRDLLAANEAQLQQGIRDDSYKCYYYIGYPMILIGLVLMIVRLALIGREWSVFWILFGIGIVIKIIGWILVGIGRRKYRDQIAMILIANHRQQGLIQGQAYAINPPGYAPNHPPPPVYPPPQAAAAPLAPPPYSQPTQQTNYNTQY